MKKYDKVLFHNDSQEIEWETILVSFASDPSANADTIQAIVESLLKVHAPNKKRRKSPDFAPWLTSDLRKTRDRLKK